MNYSIGSLYTLLSPHTFFHESSIWGNPGWEASECLARDQKGAPHLTSSHNNKTDLASTLPLDNNVTRKNGVLREAPLTEAGGSWKHIWWNIQKKLSVFCSIIRFHSTYLAVVNEHDSSMVFSSTQQIFLWRCITVQCPAFFPLVLSQALIFGWPVHWSNLAGQSTDPMSSIRFVSPLSLCKCVPPYTRLHTPGWMQTSNMQFVSFSFTINVGTSITF